MIVGTLFFNGRCEEAIEVYKRAFGAEVTRLVRYREQDMKNGIADAEVFMHGMKFWFTDEPGGPRSQVVVFKELNEVMHALNLIKETGGRVTHEPGKTPFSVCETAAYDKFGIHWGMMVKSFLETEETDAKLDKIVKKQTKGGHTFMISTILMDGNCREAIELYKKAFTAWVEKYVPFPPERKKEGIIHAELFIRRGRYWLSDDGGPHGLGMMAVFSSVEKCQKAWDILKDGAKIVLAPAATKWSKREGVLIDKFGIPWGFIVWDKRVFSEGGEMGLRGEQL